jgi:glucosaminylphosphatidylinositol acyltransferase
VTMASVKALKEQLVTGHAGSSHPWEVLWVCASAVTGCGMYNISVLGLQRLCRKPVSTLWSVILEALMIWLPMILAQSEYLYPYATWIMMGQGFFTILGMFLLASSSRKKEPPANHQPFLNDQSSPIQSNTSSRKTQTRLGYLTLYRSSILYLTFIAILAVDFPAFFPRRFCKTEEAGYGLMDVGAASFCISAGLVGAKRRNRQDATSSMTTTNIWKPFLHAAPLVVIGIIRIITNRELEYQEHITEYGVHWNFFFTLGVLTIVPAILKGESSSKPSLMLPLSTMILYQLALSLLQLQVFIEKAPRNTGELHEWVVAETETTTFTKSGTFDGLRVFVNGILYLDSYLPMVAQFFLANREGMLGCLGYVSLYYIGEWVGFYFLWNETNMERDLGLLAATLWAFHLGLVHLFQIPVSRRSTNLGFCSWAVAHNIGLLYFLCLLENRVKSLSKGGDGPATHIVPRIWDTVNRHGLLMFLVANLLTGLVNLALPTLEMSSFSALIVMHAYICAVGFAAESIDVITNVIFGDRTTSALGESKKKV